jgi:hypothetical protein
VLALSPLPRGIIEAPSASATWRMPARIKGQHGAEVNLAVLPRRRAPHRAGQHACRTSILPRAAFVYAAPAVVGRPSWGLAVCSRACGVAARLSCAVAAIAGRSTATAIAPDMRAARRCTERADAGSEPRRVGGCMPPGWPGIGRSWRKGPTAMPRDDASPAEPPGRATTHCHWCGRFCLLPLRRGFLRRCDHRRGRVGQARTECKPPW